MKTALVFLILLIGPWFFLPHQPAFVADALMGFICVIWAVRKDLFSWRRDPPLNGSDPGEEEKPLIIRVQPGPTSPPGF